MFPNSMSAVGNTVQSKGPFLPGHMMETGRAWRGTFGCRPNSTARHWQDPWTLLSGCCGPGPTARPSVSSKPQVFFLHPGTARTFAPSLEACVCLAYTWYKARPGDQAQKTSARNRAILHRCLDKDSGGSQASHPCCRRHRKGRPLGSTGHLT